MLLLDALSACPKETVMSLPAYTVWFRGRPACPCLAEWLPWFEKMLILRGVVRESIDIAQLIGSAAASANTHSTGGAFDIWQHDPVTVAVARQMGADATWARTTGSFANNRHTHGVLTGCPHNSAARYQITEVIANGDGLLGDAPDPGPRPLSGRTWRQGIEWAKQQLEEDMSQYAEQLDRIENGVKALRKKSAERHQTTVRAIRKGLEAIEAEVQDDATKKQVGGVFALLSQLEASIKADAEDSES